MKKIKIRAAVIKRIDLMSNFDGSSSGFRDTEVQDLSYMSHKTSFGGKSFAAKSVINN